MKYNGSWSVNNGTTYGTIDGDNLKKLRAELREIASGNQYDGDTSRCAYTICAEKNDYPIETKTLIKNRWV